MRVAVDVASVAEETRPCDWSWRIAQGIGTAGIAVALIAIGLGYAFGGRGRTWLRVIVGVDRKSVV